MRHCSILKSFTLDFSAGALSIRLQWEDESYKGKISKIKHQNQSPKQKSKIKDQHSLARFITQAARVGSVVLEGLAATNICERGNIIMLCVSANLTVLVFVLLF